MNLRIALTLLTLLGIASGAVGLLSTKNVNPLGSAFDVPEYGCPDCARLITSLEPISCLEGKLTLKSTIHGRNIHNEDNEEPVRTKSGKERVLLRAPESERLLFHRLSKIIKKLEAALADNPEDAKMLSDLAVFYLAKSTQGEYADLLRALSTIERSLKIQPNLEEAMFNHALALEKMQLPALARDAWHSYLEQYPSSPWLDEAREHLEKLSITPVAERWKIKRNMLDKALLQGQEIEAGELIADFSQSMREYVEERVFSAWAEKTAEKNSEAALNALQIARRVGIEIANRAGDYMIKDAVTAIEVASREAGKLGFLVEAHRSLGEGIILYKNGDIDEAAKYFRQAEVSFNNGGSPFHLWAKFYLAVCGYYRPDYQSVIDELSNIEDLDKYPILRGRVLWVKGLAHKELGNFTHALKHYMDALSVFAASGESENEAAVLNLISGVFDSLGNENEAWRYRLNALELLPEVYSARRLHNILGLTAEAVAGQGEPRIALLFQDEVVKSAENSSDSFLAAIALWQRAALYCQLRQVNKALSDLRAAEVHSEKIKDINVRSAILADVRYVGGVANKDLDPSKAMLLFSESIDFYRDTDLRFKLPGAYRERAGLYRAQGDRVLEMKDLEAGIGEIEKQRRALQGGEHRVGFFDDAASGLFDEMISLQVESGGYGEGFNYSERGRSRALLDYFAALSPGSDERRRALRSSPEPMKWREVSARLPERVVVIEYVVLQDQVLAWIVNKDGISFVPLSVGSNALAAIVGKFYDNLERGDAAEIEASLSRLYDVLLEPLESFVPRYSTLAFVADKFLSSVPFAALFDRRSGRYLVEDHAVGITPSATLHALAISRERHFSCGPSSRTVAVGNPSFDRSLFPSLPSLPGAEREAQSVQEIFPQVDLLVGAGATKEAFETASLGKDMIVFSGHAITNERFPLMSGLLFARSEHSSGLLTVRELYGKRLAQVRVVVLSACRSGRKSLGREGLTSLAEGFLAAGVPSVIASLWDVDDNAYSLLQAFYEGMKEGDAPLAALRSAQLKALKSDNQRLRSPSFWGVFTFVGGSDVSRCDEVN